MALRLFKEEIDMIKLDNYDFENTAKAVFAMNPYAREKYEDWHGLCSYMESLARLNSKSTSYSTGGFQLTFFTSENGDRHVRASVSAYTALKYVESLQVTDMQVAA
jgi:hypothetical protein